MDHKHTGAAPDNTPAVPEDLREFVEAVAGPMATYIDRETDEHCCAGCNCAEIFVGIGEPAREVHADDCIVLRARALLASTATPASAQPANDRNTALEEAASVCDAIFKERGGVAFLYAAQEIRALKSGAQPVAAAPADPVAWIRYRTDGCYEGPIMHSAMEEVRRKSGAWTPLYAPAAPVAQDEINAGQVPTAAWLVEWETASGGKRHMVAMHNFVADIRAEHGNATVTELVRRTPANAQQAEAPSQMQDRRDSAGGAGAAPADVEHDPSEGGHHD